MSNAAAPIDLEGLSHSARVRKAVELGRQARSDPDAARLLVGWQTGGFTHRLLATMACHGSRDVAALVALCGDPSRTIASLALASLTRVGDDASLVAVLRTLPARRLARTLSRLRRRRPNVVDAVITERLAGGDPAAWPLVALGSPELVDRHLADVAERGGGVFWRRLAVQHPARATEAMIARLDRLTGPDGVLFAHARTVIENLTHRHPASALRVVEALHRHLPLASIPLHTLAGRQPVPVADLVLASADPVYLSFERVLHRLGTERIIALAQRGAHLVGSSQYCLAKLPPADRVVVYQELHPSWAGRGGVVPVTLVRCLPTRERVAEARRMLDRPVLAARPLQRLPFAALLPWDEVRAQCETWLGHPEAEYRAAALVTLCEATRFDRGKLGDLLELLLARQFEQDPVRLAFLTALSDLPPGRWQAAHLDGLGRIIRAALDAADLSSDSVAALGAFLFGMLLFHPTWAVEQLAELTRERGFPGGGPQRPLTPEDVRRITPALTPILPTWLDREHVGAILALAGCVGRWLPLWPELGAAIERLLDDAQQFVASLAMTLLCQHLPEQRERIITTTLAGDPSWVLHPAVLTYLHRRRQDLLTPYLGRQAYKGRFSTGKVRHVLPLTTGFHRWTDAQQETFAQTLAEVARTPARKKDTRVTWEVLFAVRRLPALPAVGPERLLALARDSRQAVRETAVRALGRLDARQGIAELIDALGDDRARWAIYALRQALRDLTPERVIAVLRAAPLRKVTVAKEVVRLAGEFGGLAVLPWFQELDGRQLHRDVRGALLRALWDHLESPAAWVILDGSAGSPKVGVVIGLARMPIERATGAIRQRIVGLFLRLLDHPEPTVRVAILDRLANEPVPDPERVLLVAALAKLASAIPDERTAGLRMALANATEADAGTFMAAFTDLLPRRRELAEAVEEFVTQTAVLGDRQRPVRSAVLAAVEADPACALVQVRLAVATLPRDDLAGWIVRLAGTDHWHAGTQVALLEALTESSRAPAELERLDSTLARATDPAVRWLAFRLLEVVAGRQGWTAPRKKRLARYQADPHPAVADPATFTFFI